MKYSEHVSLLKRVTSDLELADLTRALMSGVRHIDESDETTLKRVIEEYRRAKYSGEKIPGSVRMKEEKR